MSKYSHNTPPDIAGAIRWVYEKVEPGKIFLDFGCSTGYFGAVLKEKGLKVYGAEISEDRYEAEKILDGVYSFDLDGDWPDNVYERKYDYVLFGDVLEHVKEPATVLIKAKKLLKKDGVIFVSIPNIAHMSIRLELLRGMFVYEPMGILDNTHLQYFTLETFKDVAVRAGFSAELIDYTENDIPKDVYKKILSEIGLSASHLFWETQFGLEARAYQYKFALRSNPARHNTRKKTIVKPLQYRDNIIQDFRKQLDNLDQHSRRQAEIIEHFKRECAALESKNNRLEQMIAVSKNPFSYIVKHGAKGIVAKRRKNKSKS